jgi:Transposase DDE domain
VERKLWKVLYVLTNRLDSSGGKGLYSTADILVVYYWAVVHDRPTLWAANPREWPDGLRPLRFPSQSTLSRRLRRPEAVALLTAVEEYLVALTTVESCLVHILDGKSLAVSGVSKDQDTAYGRGAGQKQKGYKLHAVWGRCPIPTAWALTPMNTSEKTIARLLIPTMPGGGYLLADAQYDVNALYDLSMNAGFQLVAEKRKGGLGHRPQSPGRLRSIELLKTDFGRQLYRQRNAIETRFGTMVCTGGALGPLPAWVRRFPRVRNWVQAKLLVIAARWLILHEPHMLALA